MGIKKTLLVGLPRVFIRKTIKIIPGSKLTRAKRKK
jgi:hypothetical protein